MVNYRPYPEYKPSGVEWIGDIPGGWEVSRIKNVSKVFGRIGFRGYKFSDIVSEGEGAVSLSPSNIVDNKLDLNTCTLW